MARCALAGRKCPRTSDPKAKHFCPLWYEEGIVYENVRTGETMTQQCGARLLYPSLIEVIKASNRPAASIDKVATEIATGFAQLGVALQIVDGRGR